MKKYFVVLGVGNSGKKFPLAVSSVQSKAVGYADMCECNTSVRKCTDTEVLGYIEKFYVLNLD